MSYYEIEILYVEQYHLGINERSVLEDKVFLFYDKASGWYSPTLWVSSCADHNNVGTRTRTILLQICEMY